MARKRKQPTTVLPIADEGNSENDDGEIELTVQSGEVTTGLDDNEREVLLLAEEIAVEDRLCNAEVIDEGRIIHDEEDVKDIRQRARKEAPTFGIIVSAEDERISQQLFPKVCFLHANAHTLINTRCRDCPNVFMKRQP